MRFDSAIGPTYGELRPYKHERTTTFPVYADLSEMLLRTTSCPDPDLAFVMAVCSAYAYGDASTVAMMAARLGLEHNRCWTVSEYVDAMFLTSTAHLIQSDDGRVMVLAYRGTPPTSVITWLTDFQVDPVRIRIEFPSREGENDGYDVHSGFYRNVRSTRPTIIEALQRAIAGEPVTPDGDAVAGGLEALYITGHSLGGASAAMLAAMLVTEPAYAPIVERLRAVYTYGAPMIGSPEFAEACEREMLLRDRVIRYVYVNDIVPQVPPAESGRFRHFGREYQYRLSGEAGAWHHNDEPRAQLHNLVALVTTPLTMFAKAFTATRHIPFHASLNDHLPEYYVAALTPPNVESEYGS